MNPSAAMTGLSKSAVRADSAACARAARPLAAPQLSSAPASARSGPDDANLANDVIREREDAYFPLSTHELMG
jgi:hypothetical protein